MTSLSPNVAWKRRLVILALVGTLMALGVQWWLPPLLAFLGASNNLIQGLINFVQFVLWGIVALLVLVGLWDWSKSESEMVPLTKTPNSKPSLQNDRKLSTVSWDARDAELLRYYFELCATHDHSFRKHAQGEQKQILDYFLANGLAGKGQDRRIYLTQAGLLLCCRRDLIPRHTFHVHINFSHGDLRTELFGSVLYLYRELIKLLQPIFERRFGSPDIRDQFGSEKVFFDYPPIAVREALINFLIHRDYLQDDIGYIIVSSDKIEFINPGQSEYLSETLLEIEHPLQPRSQRNPTLIAAINKSGLNQSQGHGILSIKQELLKNQSIFADGKAAFEIKNDGMNNRFVLTINKKDLYLNKVDYHFISEIFNSFDNKLGGWLGREPQRIALQIALERTYTTFARHHPQWATALFDNHFLQNGAAPLLARCVTRANPPEAKEFAIAWADQMGLTNGERKRTLSELTPVASDFLRLFDEELRVRAEFRPLFDSRALDTTAAATMQTAEVVKNLQEELTQLLAQMQNALEGRRQTADPTWSSPVAILADTASIQVNHPQKEFSMISEDGQLVVDDKTLHPLLSEHHSRSLVNLAPPFGAVNLRDGFYVQREADYYLKYQLDRMGGAPIIIRGSRQTGKTSLLVRGIHYARQNGIKVVHLDLQSVSRADFETYEYFLRYLAEYIVWELKLDLDKVEQAWRRSRSPQDKLSRLLQKYVLPQSDKPILLAIDEADHLLKSDFHTDFFGLLRSWYNRGATDKRWRKLHIVLLISTEPHLLIADPYQSPFNVGHHINLQDFNEEQVRDLNERHGSPVTEEELPQLMVLLGGQPYLTRQALYTLITKSLSWAEFNRIALSDQGPFGGHLRRYQWLLHDQPTLKAALREVIEQNRCSDEMIFYRLLRAGLVRGRANSCTCRCDLYRQYFEDKLS